MYQQFKRVTNYTFLSVSLIFLSSCTSISDSQNTTALNESERSDTIFATGEAVAKSRDEAIEKALLNAVRKASGVFISSELQIQDEQVLRDRLIQYSAGYIRGFEIIEENKDSTNVYIAINASISRSALLDFYAESYQEESVAIEGEQLYQSIKREVNRREDRLSVLPQIFESFPENAIIPKLISQQSKYTDDRDLYINVTWEISWSQTFFEALYQHAVEMSDANCGMFRDQHYGWLPGHACGQLSFIDNDSEWWNSQYGTSYIFNDSEYTAALSEAIGDRGWAQEIAMRLDFLGTTGQNITSACARVDLNASDGNEFMMWGHHRGYYIFQNRSLTGTVEIKMSQPDIMKDIVKVTPKIVIKC